ETISKRGLNRIEPVGGRDEQHLRQIEWQVEIMIGEGVVLLRIEYLEQRGGRVAPEIGPDLVDLVEQDNGISGFDAPQRLNDPTGHRSDVRSPMTANLRFIAQSPESKPREL